MNDKKKKEIEPIEVKPAGREEGTKRVIKMLRKADIEKDQE
jgi:hypothetical protein